MRFDVFWKNAENFRFDVWTKDDDTTIVVYMLHLARIYQRISA